jgi:hypothetical protein
MLEIAVERSSRRHDFPMVAVSYSTSKGLPQGHTFHNRSIGSFCAQRLQDSHFIDAITQHGKRFHLETEVSCFGLVMKFL